MAEPDKRQIGDGSDNYGEAAKQMAKAAKEAGIETAKQAAVKGAEAGANAAAATVQAGVEGGKAVAEIAAGTAAGGPWGAILSAAWAMRHTLFKILVCICLFFLVIIVLIVSLPSVVTNSVFGLDGSMVDMENPTTLLESYNHLAADISAVVEEGYDAALAKVEQIIEDGGYDYDLSMDALINYAQGSAGYDVSYILAAYSASLQQRNTGKEDMLAKLRSVADSMFPVAFVEKESEQIVPFTYATYRPVTVTVVTSKTQTGTINGVPQYRYTTARRTYYEPDETITTSEPVNVAAYTPVVVSVPIYSGGRITGTRSETYYEQDGNETLTPETEVVKYVECTIQPFDNSVIIRAFGIDPSATYDQFKITYGEAIQKMANALKMTLYGTLGNGQMVPLTDAELIAFVNAQSCSPMRKHILTTALSLVGKVPYFWGGKSAPGWNDAWNTPRLVTSAGSPTTGTIRPFGLDCSGFTTWVFNTAVGVEIGAGCNGQYPNTYGISAAELLPGDLGFLADDDGWGHVLIFAGYDAEGTRMWVHSSGGIGVILNTPSYEGRLSYRRLSIVDYDAPVVNSPNGEALYTLEVEVTHYCACAKCCGSNAQGLTASGKQAAVGMVAMYYSFLYIKAGGYPSRVRAGWMSSLINAGEGVDIDVHLRRENRSRTIDKVAQRIRLNRTKLKSMQDTSTDYEELTNSIQAGYFIKNGIANYNEDLFYMSVFITVSAKTYEELLWRKQQMVDMLKSMDMYTSECSFQQEAALQSVMPFLKISPKLEKKAQRNVLTSGAASSYIFTSFELSDDNGVLLGINRYNNSLCIVDLFNTKINKNANLNLLGTSGAGKTFTMQLLALRMRMRGIQCYILAPIKGHEFRRACNKIGGEFIKIAPGSPHCINVMEIRHTMSPEMELIDEIDYVEMGSMLARKIQQLMTFFGLLIPDMSNEEEQMLDEALIRTYADFGITHDNDSIYTDMSSVPPKMKQMPILGDLHKHLQENPMTQRLAAIISRFVTGSAQSFNRQTNVDLSNKYIVLDLSELKGKLLPVGMFIALDYVWDQIKSDRTKRKAIFIDEIWQLIGASSNRMAAEFCLEIFKVIRGFGGAAISATQDLSDFFGLEDGKYGRAIINNSKNKIILNLEPDEARYVQETLKLTRTEIRAITRFERGEALISSNNNKVPVVVKASKLEKEMITTDRAELEAILKERQREKTHSA